MQLIFDTAKWQQDDDGFWISFKVDNPVEAKRFLAKMKPKKYTAEVKEYREKRSLNANNFLWRILDQMAEVVGSTKEELYLGYVRMYGIYKDFELTPDEAKTFCVAWPRLGTGWPTEQVDYTPDGAKVVIRAYYGSSQYNTKQMSRLLDKVVEDAKEIGIETLTPLELARLKEEW